MVLAYQAILVLNVLFLIGSAFALKLLCQNLFPSISATFATILAFVTILYPGYIYNSQSASSNQSYYSCSVGIHMRYIGICIPRSIDIG